MRGDTVCDGDASQIPRCLEKVDQAIKPLFKLRSLSESRICMLVSSDEEKHECDNWYH